MTNCTVGEGDEETQRNGRYCECAVPYAIEAIAIRKTLVFSTDQLFSNQASAEHLYGFQEKA